MVSHGVTWCHMVSHGVSVCFESPHFTLHTLVARRTNNRKVVGSMPANTVCIIVLTGNRLE